ncbi:hypothetical protein [Pseudomonas poae]|uniref:hypothetical protein n=1 Tax=Pseudomonas poae TaxID=200451 RepID=UPI001645DA40|nr:hypothetical protein [Pseudomonas poae]MBC3199874.1 hypothetical protein [Pseudomonas poae]
MAKTPPLPTSTHYQSMAGELRAPAKPGMPDWQSVQVVIEPKDLCAAMDIFFSVAKAHHIRKPRISVTQSSTERAASPANALMGMQLKFRPDRADGTYSPSHLNNVNQVEPDIRVALIQAGVLNHGPVD